MIVSVLGLEPRTNGLKGHCSTIELYAHIRTSISLTPLGGTVKTFSEIGLSFPACSARMVRLFMEIYGTERGKSHGSCCLSAWLRSGSVC